MAIYYWKGSTGGTASNYAWNVPQNWVKLVKPNPYSSYTALVGATNGIPSSGDDVYIGGFVTGPTCLSPLVYGGYSGAGNTGCWISNIGTTGATTASGQLNSLTIGWQTGATAKYPFTHIGGGKNIVWDMTGSDYSSGGVGTQTPGLTPDVLVGTYFDTLTVLSNATYETSAAVSTPTRTIKLNYALGPTAFNQKLFNNTIVKGSRNLAPGYIENGEWEGGRASSTTKMIVSGFVNRILDQSAPSANYWTSGLLDYGKPEVYFQGCTFSEYKGHNNCNLMFDQDSTAALIQIKSWYNYPYRFQTKYPTHKFRGEVNAAKALNALGLGITGGPTGAGSGTVIIDADWETGFDWIRYGDKFESNFRSTPSREDAGFVFVGSGAVSDGITTTAKIGEIDVIAGYQGIDPGETQFVPLTRSNTHTVFMQGNCAVSLMKLQGSEMTPYAEAQSLSIAQLNMSRFASVWLGNDGDGVNWQFGVTAGATGATAIVGGIIGDDTSYLRLNSNVPLFNKNLTRTFKNTTYSTAGQVYSATDPVFETENIKKEAL